MWRSKVSDKPTQDQLFEMFQKMVNPMAFPLQGLLMGGLSAEEVDKKIAELTTVRHWLNSNLGMLDLTIKTLEYQKALLSPAGSDKKDTEKGENPLSNPALWPWNFLNQAGEAAAKAAQGAQKKGRGKS
jgi:hypothetical protein